VSLAFGHAEPEVTTANLSADIKANQKNAELMLRRAESYRASRNWTAALADYSAAEELGMGIDVAFYRSRMYLDAGNWTQAMSVSNAFLELHPENSAGLVTLAYAEYGAGKRNTAIGTMEQALSNHPTPTADEFVDLSRWYLESNDLGGALSSLDKGATRLGSPVSFSIRRVELLQNAGAYPDAVLSIDELPAALREQPEWLMRRGDLLMLAGEDAEALEAFLDAQYALSRLPDFRRNNPVNRNLRQELASRLGTAMRSQ
jgi:tetratricopeptide (TPR) repeat protein